MTKKHTYVNRANTDQGGRISVEIGWTLQECKAAVDEKRQQPCDPMRLLLAWYSLLFGEH